MLPIIMIIENNEDKEKVTEIYNQYSGTMLYIAEGILHDIQLAEDAVSEAFIKIINHLEKINEVNCYQTRGFVVIIVRNVALDMLRKQKRSQTVFLDDYNETIGYEEPDFNNITAKEACKRIVYCLGRLNKNYSDILYLKIAFDCSYEEIGKILGISQKNVKTRLSRARKALKVELEKEDNCYDQKRKKQSMV
ncbi:MAG: sigma-70 family RNA polymerase sigma factor [Lachnospiraceae bacterium]|nr:sigma-70 family RNA polymerase sigma factor [Lachnospiraceae bacterium]